MIIHSRRREEKQVAVSGLDKTSKCREEAVQAALANNTAPLCDTALAHTGREQVQRHALAGMGMAPLARKTNYPTRLLS